VLSHWGLWKHIEMFNLIHLRLICITWETQETENSVYKNWLHLFTILTSFTWKHYDFDHDCGKYALVRRYGYTLQECIVQVLQGDMNGLFSVWNPFMDFIGEDYAETIRRGFAILGPKWLWIIFIVASIRKMMIYDCIFFLILSFALLSVRHFSQCWCCCCW